MIPVSIVIITKNEAEIITDCITAAMMISDDIIIMDNGSTDQTVNIACKKGCRVYSNIRGSYGANKNKGIEMARYDWILSIDADEIPDMELILALYDLKLDDAQIAYDIKYRTYFGGKRIRFGHWGRDHHVRLFNRKLVKWSEPKVHETLILPKATQIQQLSGYLHHYSVKDKQECMAKAINYAKLSADSYFYAGKKPGIFSMYLSPCFGFFVNYILFLGILDGKKGWQIARTIFKNKWLKYHYLSVLENAHKKKQFVDHGLNSVVSLSLSKTMQAGLFTRSSTSSD